MASREWIKKVPELPRSRTYRTARVWDLAATNAGGDFTVGTKSSYDSVSQEYYLQNVIRHQLSPGAVEDLVRRTAIADGVDCEIYIEQEPGSAGKSLVEHYQKTVLKEFTVHPIPVTEAKIVRAQPLLAAAESGGVFIVEGSWNEVFLREFDSFPGAYDDQVDTASAGYTILSGKRTYSASWGRKPRSSSANSKKLRRAMFQSSDRSHVKVTGATFGRRRY